MTDEFDNFFEDFQLCRKSIGFVSDHIDDPQAMAVLMRVEKDMSSLEDRFRALAVQ